LNKKQVINYILASKKKQYLKEEEYSREKLDNKVICPEGHECNKIKNLFICPAGHKCNWTSKK